jgi:uncharacterized protein YcbX
MTSVLSSLHIYPVKSCRRVDLEETVVEPWGLAGDRRWVVVGEDTVRLTQRTLPRMALVQPEVAAADGRLTLRAPGMPEIELAPPLRAQGAEPVAVTVGRFAGHAASAGAEADAWFSAYLGSPARLAYMDDTSARATNPEYSLAQDRVSFADGYPLLLTSTASLSALGSWIADTGGEPVPMTRFRPNVVVEGTEPWAEEGWSRVRLGEQVFRVVKPCDRCVMTTVDPERGKFDGGQPLKALRKYHRAGKLVYFGMNLIPDTAGPLRVGDDFAVLA